MTDSRQPELTLELNREKFRISDEFLARYNRPGPRYTSYPTAPVWKDDFGSTISNTSTPRPKPRARRSRLLHAPALLRKSLPVLRLQRGHHQRSRRRLRRISPRSSAKSNNDQPLSSRAPRAKSSSSTGAAARPPISRPRRWKTCSATQPTVFPSHPTPKSASKSIRASPASSISKACAA